MATFKAAMTLYDKTGGRLYLNKNERERFLNEAAKEVRENRMFCHVIHYCGCRISEVLALSSDRILIEDRVLVFQTLKKRKFDNKGNKKEPEYRRIEVPDRLIEELDLTFDLRRHQKSKDPEPFLLFPKSRSTGWRIIKRVLDNASIKGSQATPKGFRHGFGIAMAQSGMPLTELKKLLGHASTDTVEIYLAFQGEERRELVMKGWQ